jgi:thiamine biosynthesis lipoprotein
MKKIEFPAMGSQISAFLDVPDDEADVQLDQVQEWFLEWEQRFSRFNPDSELTELNAHAGTWSGVSREMFDLLRLAKEAYRESNRLVNAALLPLMKAYGYWTSFDDLEKAQSGFDGRTFDINIDLSELILDEDALKVYLPKDMQIDLGGIAKGWAANEAMRRLSPLGPALVNAGGDIAISESMANGELWTVGINDPQKPGEWIEILQAGPCGIATSGIDRRQWRQGETLRHHVIDPRTLRPVESDVQTATCIANDVMQAEIGAKSILTLGSGAGLDWLAEQKDMHAVVVCKDRSVIYSPDLTRQTAII